MTAVPAAAQSGPRSPRSCSYAPPATARTAIPRWRRSHRSPASRRFFVLNQLFLMREGVRKVEAMAAIVKDLKDQDLTRSVGALRQALRPSAATSRSIRSSVKRGKEIAAQQRCASCHLPTLAGQEQMPRVARQRIDYLVPTLKSVFRDHPRDGADTAMSPPVGGLHDARPHGARALRGVAVGGGALDGCAGATLVRHRRYHSPRPTGDP